MGHFEGLANEAYFNSESSRKTQKASGREVQDLAARCLGDIAA